MIEIKPLEYDEKADGFKYAVALMSKAMKTRMDLLISIKYKGFDTDFMMTIHDCGDLPLLKRAFGKEYGLKKTHTIDHVFKKLGITNEKTILVQNSFYPYNLSGTIDFPFRNMIVSGKPMMIFSNFKRDRNRIYYDITLSITMPDFIDKSMDT